jgi:hypothetical protein
MHDEIQLRSSSCARAAPNTSGSAAGAVINASRTAVIFQRTSG